MVWQTGSGTQSNMNANEVIANRGNQIAGEKLPAPQRRRQHEPVLQRHLPHGHAYCGGDAIEDKPAPGDRRSYGHLPPLEVENEGIVKTGRTHLQDATPISFAQEITGWRGLLERDREELELWLERL